MKRLSCIILLLPLLNFTFVDGLSARHPRLLAYWEFNDVGDTANAVDTVAGYVGVLEGTGRNIAAYTAEAGGRTGAAGDYGMDLGTGSDGQTVRVADASYLNTGSNTVTYSFWQQLTEVASTSTFWAVSPSSSGSERGAQAHVPWGNGTIFFDTAGCCGGGAERISSMVPDHDYVSEWSHYAFVKNGDTKEVWVNGTLAFEGTNTSPLPTDFTELYLGSAPGGGSSIRGKIDDFAIFDVALKPGQIKRLAGGASAVGIPEPSGFVLLLLGAFGLTCRLRKKL